MPAPRPVRNPLFARFFDRFAARDEERGQAELRRELLSGLSGRVLEIGAGNGLNFPHYPSTVRQLVAVEPEPYLRSRAAEVARGAPVPTQVVDGVADRISAQDGSFDAVVASGVLCSVPDVPAALAEFRRVLRADGELRFYEHVRAVSRIRARFQDLVDVLWPRLMGGCHVNRDTLSLIRQAGYRIERSRRLNFPPSAVLCPNSPRIIGVARP